MSLFNNLKGICLGKDTRWVIEGISGFEMFFRHLEKLLPEGSAVVYVEGISISPDVRKFLQEHSISPWHKVYPGTVWPQPSTFHVQASSEVLNGLMQLASCHVSPEIADHCHVYTKDRMILQWYDANCSDPLLVDSTIPENKVKAFCDCTGTHYTAHRQF